MCGRIVQVTPPDQVARAMDAVLDVPLRDPSAWAPSWNLPPTSEALILAPGEDRPRLESASWGLVPPGGATPTRGLFNARAETVDRLPSFRDAFRSGRVVVPVDAFYEWENPEHLAALGLAPPPRGPRQPWAYLPADSGLFAFAAISTVIPDGDGAPKRSFSLITTEANGVVGLVHDRMPVILVGDAERQVWLDPQTPVERLRASLGPAPDAFLIARRVSPAVSDVRKDGPGLLDEAPGYASLF